MFRALRERKNKKHEEDLKKIIEFNNERSKLYRSASQDVISPDSTIYKLYSEEFMDKMEKEYNVDSELIEQAKLSAEKAEKEYDKAKVRVEKYKKEKEKDEKVELYKRAILELKEEGRI